MPRCITNERLEKLIIIFDEYPATDFNDSVYHALRELRAARRKLAEQQAQIKQLKKELQNAKSLE